mgnify:CR=1 FL=1
METKDRAEEIKPIEIKDLNKTQLILLAILLSFITSIATGIVTVTLMQQAPTGVTQTINRVVQQTIEKVVPDYTQGKTQTIIVKEDELVVDAVAKIRTNLGGLYSKTDGAYMGSVYSIGKGVFITSAGNMESIRTYSIKKDTIVLDVKTYTVSPELGIAVLTAGNTEGDEKKLATVDVVKDSDIKAGQTLVIADTESVRKGTVQSLGQESVKDENGAVVMTWSTIGLGIPLRELPLGPVTNLDGALAGFVSENIKGAEIIAADAVMKFIQTPLKTASVPQAPPDTP